MTCFLVGQVVRHSRRDLHQSSPTSMTHGGRYSQRKVYAYDVDGSVMNRSDLMYSQIGSIIGYQVLYSSITVSDRT